MTTSTETDKRPRTWTKLWVALGILAVVILLLPTICSYVIVPGIIQSEINDSVEGTVSVSGTSFSWFGSQEIDSITITSTDQDTDLKLAVQVHRSLLGLIFNWANLGTIDVTIQGKGKLFADGSTSFNTLQKPSTSENAPSSSSSSGGLPSGLNVDLKLSIPSFELEVVDQKTSLNIDQLTADAAVSAGGPVNLKLDTTVKANGSSGTVNAEFVLENGTTSEGRLQLADATLKGSIKAKGLELPAGGQWVQISEVDLSANSTSLSKGTQVRGTGSGTMDNQSPISMKTTLDFGSLVAQDGSFSIGPDSISGTLDADSIPTSLIQPFMGNTPLRLARDIGPQVNLSMNADSGTPRSIKVNLKSERMTATADLGVSKSAISNGSMQLANQV